ncbi:MAG: periplasmic sensor signal transduction histidine kinase [Candidatus Sulfotelmatobacter sp.]|nr:periplasmic sensor signal transduction histidine kinase [Candidatus Sulfotelmatobacter sp.]
MKLRAKFLVSLCAILVAFACTTLLVVRHTCQVQIREMLISDLRSSIVTFRAFERSRERNLTSGSELLASLPSLKALMTTNDAATIQDGSEKSWRLIASDLFVLSDRTGKVMAVHTAAARISPSAIEQSLQTSFHNPRSSTFCVVGPRLFQIFSQPIYFGPPSDAHLLGVLTLGYEINYQEAKEVSEVAAASQVAFEYGSQVITSTPPLWLAKQFSQQVPSPSSNDLELTDVQIGDEHFLASSLMLATGPIPIRLVVLKSFDRASLFLRQVNHILLGLSIGAIAFGCLLVFLMCHKFTRPLDDLLAGVRALESGNFSYPLSVSKQEEFTELTRSFDHMRTTLLSTQKQLLESERLATIGTMASSISHDLRHRLTAVVANSEFLADDQLSPSYRQELHAEVNRAVRRMTNMLEALQEFSRRPESSVRVELMSLEEIVQEGIEGIKLHPEFQDVKITFQIKEHLYGWFDSARLERAFYNLLLNACEVVPKKGGLIDILIQRTAQRAEILVSDNGPGVPAEIRNTLFQPFVSHGKQKGTGLGLAIVEKACNDNGGHVSLERSAPGLTTFKIVLPIETNAPHTLLVAEKTHEPVTFGVVDVS